MANLSLHLKPVPPFRLDLTVWVLRRRPHNLMDRWDGETYRRILLVGDQPVAVAVRQTGPPEVPELRVTCRINLTRGGPVNGELIEYTGWIPFFW